MKQIKQAVHTRSTALEFGILPTCSWLPKKFSLFFCTFDIEVLNFVPITAHCLSRKGANLD